MIAVLDTNLIVSSLLQPTGIPARIIGLVLEGKVRIALSDDLLAEYRDVLTRAEIARFHRRTPQQIDEYLEELAAIALHVANPPDVPPVQPDRKDDKILSLAVGARANYIVSGDKRHLVRLGAFEGIPIVLPAAFFDLISPPQEP